MLRSNELLDSLKAGRTDDNVPQPLQAYLPPERAALSDFAVPSGSGARLAQLKMPALIIQGNGRFSGQR